MNQENQTDEDLSHFAGVYTVCTTQLAEELPSAFFRVLGTAFSVTVTLLWIVVASGTLWKAFTGEMFFAPCLKDLAEEDMKPHFIRKESKREK